MEILPILFWLGMLTVVSPGALIGAWFFEPPPSRRAGFALPISLGILALVAFWIGHIVLWPWALVTGLVVLVGLAGTHFDRVRKLTDEINERTPVTRQSSESVGIALQHTL